MGRGEAGDSASGQVSGTLLGKEGSRPPGRAAKSVDHPVTGQELGVRGASSQKCRDFSAASSRVRTAEIKG